MGRGASKAGGSSNRSSERKGTGKQSVSGKAFNANDWETWTVGTKVEYNAGNDYGIMDNQVRRSTKEFKYDGVVTQIGDDHIIVRADDSNLRVDKDTAFMFKAKKNRR